MDSAAKRGGIGKSRGSAGKGSERGGKSARVDSASFQREVLRHVASNDRSMRNSAPTNSASPFPANFWLHRLMRV